MKAIFLAAMLLGSCTSMPGGERLTERQWSVSDVNGTLAIAGAVPTVRLADGKISGSTGCNQYSADYRMESDQRISTGVVSQTRRACEPAVMAQEASFLSILDNVAGYSVYRDGSLALIAEDGRAIRLR